MNRNHILGVVCVLAMGAAACGRSTSPAAPTLTSSNAIVNEPAATSSAIVFGTAVQRLRPSADALTAEATASISAVSGTCPTVTFTILGTPVQVNSTTVFGTGITCAGLTVGTTVHVTAAITVGTGGVLSVVATRITVDTTTPGTGETPETGHGKKVSGEGTVGHLTGTCPAVSMMIGGTRVTTTESTTYEDGACGNLRSGTKVVVTGETQSDGSVVATLVRVTDNPGGANHVAGEGTVASVKGACPTLTMVIEGYAVVTSATTEYTGGACSDLKAGARVSVSGTTAASTLMAESVTILKTRGRQ